MRLIGRERPAALGGEHEGTVGVLAAQLAKGADLVATQRVDTRPLILGTTDMQHRVPAKLHLAPFEIGNLTSPQTVPIGHEDQHAVTMPMAALAGLAGELFNLGRGARP